VQFAYKKIDTNFFSGSMEVHFVHFKTEYGDLATALTKQDGLAIVAILFVVIFTRNFKLN
jgi:hypothetical protein